jgi:hypothetical protein
MYDVVSLFRALLSAFSSFIAEGGFLCHASRID